jgi:hypothetical protein
MQVSDSAAASTGEQDHFCNGLQMLARLQAPAPLQHRQEQHAISFPLFGLCWKVRSARHSRSFSKPGRYWKARKGSPQRILQYHAFSIMAVSMLSYEPVRLTPPSGRRLSIRPRQLPLTKITYAKYRCVCVDLFLKKEKIIKHCSVPQDARGQTRFGKKIEKEGVDEWFDNYGLMNAML